MVTNPRRFSPFQGAEERPGCHRRCLGKCCIPGAALPVYAFHGGSSRDWSSGSDSENIEAESSFFLNKVILSEWRERMTRGLFRYDITSCKSKRLPGSLGFIAQLNEGRYLKKRPTELRVDQVLQSFDSEKFNFTKIGQEELLFCFEESTYGSHGYHERVVVGSCSNVVVVNVSPIDYGHVLLVPKLHDCKPQRIDRESFQLAVKFVAEAGDRNFRVGYNSLGAFATVNHLHFQAYCMAFPLAVERACVTSIFITRKHGGVDISELVDYPVLGLVYSSEGAGEELAPCVSEACIALQNCNISYNVLISDCGRRIFLFPQCFAERQALGLVKEDVLETMVNPGVWEISGHIVLKRREDYESASQDSAWRLLAEVSLSRERFEDVKKLCMDVPSLALKEKLSP
ncbi:hypothetical protein KP509_1Z001500 [Ceratopteris richardii]|nr:hypothetical protein KP509_1Z001500 [Ceratopteris richardii]